MRGLARTLLLLLVGLLLLLVGLLLLLPAHTAASPISNYQSPITNLQLPISNYQSSAAPTWHTFTSQNGLAGNIVQAIWEDAQGRLWFGTENGVSRYDGRAWKTYRTADGLLDNNVWFISGDADAIWFATSNGVARLQGDKWTRYTVADGLPSNDVRAVLAARDGAVWVGTFGRGIARRAPGTSRWERVGPTEKVRIRDFAVQGAWQSPGGQLWFCTSAFGAIRIDGAQIDPFTFKSSSRNTVWSVGGSDDAAWIATFRGIVRVTPDNRVKIIDEIVDSVPISDTEILAVAAERPDSIWFGTRANGVLHLAGDRWERFTTEDGLSRNYVLTILVDRAGRLWFGSRGGGVTMLDARGLADAPVAPAVVTARDIKRNVGLALDGAPLRFDQNNLQFTFAQPVDWLPAQDVRFRYWLQQDATPAAPIVQASEPGQLAQTESQPYVNLIPGKYTLHVTPVVNERAGAEQRYSFAIQGEPPLLAANALSVSANGAALPSGSSLPPVLFETTRQVQLTFRAQDDVTPPGRLKYQYRLLDQGSDWQIAEGATATLTLAQGTHQLEVRALDADGLTSATIVQPVIVPGPFWKTILLYLAAVIVPTLIGGAAGATIYRRVSQRQALLRAVRGHIIPYDVGPLISAPERYIGRQHVLDTILGRIDNNSFYVYGEKRIGKTSLLAQLRQRLAQRNGVQSALLYVPVFRNIQDVPQDLFWLALVRSVADAVADMYLLHLPAEVPHEAIWHGTPADTPTANVRAPLLIAYTRPSGYNDFDAQDDLETIVEHLRGLVAPRRPLLVLLLDEVDTLQRYDPIIRQRFRAFCQHMQEYLQVVLVGVLPPQAEFGETSPWYNILAPIALEPLGPADIIHLIRDYNANPYSYAPDAEGALIVAGDRKPYDTQWLCSEAVKTMLAARRTRVVLADVNAAVTAVVNERRREYAAFWQQATAALQGDVRRALADGGELPPDQVALGAYDRLFEAGLALRTPQGCYLAYLFQHWLRETVTG